MILKYLFNHPILNAKHAKWIEFLCEFDFEIKHINWKENKVANTLSIRFHVAKIRVCKLDLITIVLKAQNNDETYIRVIENLQ